MTGGVFTTTTQQQGYKDYQLFTRLAKREERESEGVCQRETMTTQFIYSFQFSFYALFLHLKAYQSFPKYSKGKLT